MAKKAKKRAVQKDRILPKKMSALIKIAEADLLKAEKAKTMIIDMGEWFNPEQVSCETSSGVVIETHKVCTVCYAGSVMAYSLDALQKDGWSELGPENFPKNKAQLTALNDLREGDVSDAANRLGLIGREPSYVPEYERALWSEKDQAKYEKAHAEWDLKEEKYTKLDCKIPVYNEDNPKPFHQAMKKLEQRLRKAGL